MQATSYTIEWAPRVGGTQTVWKPLTTIPATNSSYTQDVPMVYRLRADIQAHFRLAQDALEALIGQVSVQAPQNGARFVRLLLVMVALIVGISLIVTFVGLIITAPAP